MSSDEVKCVLVTGASGFIASHVVQQLLQAGHKVRGTVRSLSNETKVKHLKNLWPNPAHELELVEADLTNQQCWTSAVDGCSHVLHIASPFPIKNPADENELIKPAVQGTTFVLQACADAGTVKRVVLTSSVAAVMDIAKPKVGAYTEEDWPNLDTLSSAYSKSKYLAEKAAWDFVKELPDDKKFELSVVNPAYVIGPVLSGSTCSSMELIKRVLEKDPPANARLHIGVVDVRDVAKAHINAMTIPEAVGHRHILNTSSLWMVEFAQIIKDEFTQHGYSISTLIVPKPIFNIIGIFDRDVNAVKPLWNKEFIYDNTRMREVLKISPIPNKTSVIDMAYSLIDMGFTKKHKHYKGRPTPTHDKGGEVTGTAANANAEGDDVETTCTAASGDAINAGGDVAETGVLTEEGSKGNVAETGNYVKAEEKSSEGKEAVAETDAEEVKAEEVKTEEVKVEETKAEEVKAEGEEVEVDVHEDKIAETEKAEADAETEGEKTDTQNDEKTDAQNNAHES